jgi:hypothetical protein
MPRAYSTQAPPDLMPTAPEPSDAPRRRPARIVGLVVAVLAVTALAAGVYLLLNHASEKQGNTGNSSANTAAQSSNSAADKKAVSMSTLTGINFGLPTDLSAFKGDSSPDSNYHIYLTTGSNDSKACSLEFGTIAADKLPGSDLDSIVGPQVKALRDAGATVNGPAAGTALILKDAVSSKVTYSMPTLNYDVSKDKKHVSVHYSLVILKDGSRAVVSRQCLNVDGPADDASLAKIEAAAKQITVNKR